MLRPAVHLRATGGETGSYFGGLPELPEQTEWPTKNASPIAFVASIDLAEVAAAKRFEWLPAAGRLLFFYDMEEQPWGFDPADEGGWKVIFVDVGESVAERPSPAGLDSAYVLPRCGATLQRVELPPSVMRDEVEPLELTDDEVDAFEEYRASLIDGAPGHQIGGYPNPMQSDDMELECQLVSNGLYCGGPGSDEGGSSIGCHGNRGRLHSV